MPLHDPAKLAVFVDMDNLSVTGLETVLSRWRYRQTPVTLRRAYGGLDKLKGASAVLQRYGFHVRANHGKGTTDVLLTVDVMDALHAGLLPPVVAIASSDADFVPQAQPTPIKTLSPAKPPAPVKSPAPVKPPDPATPAEPDLAKARALVSALQPWQLNTVKQLQQAGTALRALNLVSGTKPLHTHFRQYPSVFQVMPSTGSARMVKLLKIP